MMDKPSSSAEERIRAAARVVFLAKGYDGTTSRDIAEAAGLNVAMTNYYFRSKEKLFHLTFEEMFQQYFAGMQRILNQEGLTLKERITALIEGEYSNLRQHPDVPQFITHEMHRHPNLFKGTAKMDFAATEFGRQVSEAAAAGEIPALSPLQIMALVVSNTTHPFVSKVMYLSLVGIDEAAYAVFTDQHELLVKDLILGYLFSQKNPA